MAKHRRNEMTDLVDGYVFLPWYKTPEQNRFRTVDKKVPEAVIEGFDVLNKGLER